MKNNTNNINKKSDDDQSEEITETKNIDTDENSEDKDQSDEEKETNINETDKIIDKNGKSNDKSENNCDDDNNNEKNLDLKVLISCTREYDKTNEKKEKNLDLKVFISYSREHDKIVAGLISHVLTCQGFKTLFDRRLYSGANIADHICKLISQSHAVVMILSQKSIASPWINQELGYALALNKPIIQIPIESPIKPCGMFEGLNVFDYYTDWFNDEDSIKQLTNHIHEAIEEKDSSPSIIKTKEDRTKEITDYFNYLHELLTNHIHEAIEEKDSSPSIIKTKEDRTKEITDYFNYLHELLQKDENKNIILKLYKRTSISIFSVKGPLKVGSQRYNDYYWELLRKQRKSIEKLIDENENVYVRLHLDVERREYKDNIELERFNDLIKYIEKINKNQNLRKRFKFKNEKHGQSNIIALNKHIIFEGLKPKPMDEYLYTLCWKYPSIKFNDFFLNFDDKCWKNSEDILNELRLYQKILYLKLIIKRNRKDYEKNKDEENKKDKLDFFKKLNKEVEEKKFEKDDWKNEIEKKIKQIEDDDSLQEKAIKNKLDFFYKFKKEAEEKKFEKDCWKNAIENEFNIIEDDDSLHEEAIKILVELVQELEKKYKEIKKQ